MSLITENYTISKVAGWRAWWPCVYLWDDGARFDSPPCIMNVNVVNCAFVIPEILKSLAKTKSYLEAIFRIFALNAR